MATDNTIDLFIPRTCYYSRDGDFSTCPECQSALTEHNCTLLLVVKSDIDQGEFMTNPLGSRFCHNCPTVVLDSDEVEKSATLGIKGEDGIEYFAAGMIDLDAIPEEKKHLELGTDENPIPLIEFLPNPNKPAPKARSQQKTLHSDPDPFIAEKSLGRNDPCVCGSGKKYKKCCG